VAFFFPMINNVTITNKQVNSVIETTTFKLMVDPYIEAYIGSSNKTKLNFKPIGSYKGVILDRNRFLHFSDNQCTRLDIIIKDTIVSITEFFDGDAFIAFGDFNIEVDSYEYNIIGYFGSDVTKGVVLSAGNRVNFNRK